MSVQNELRRLKQMVVKISERKDVAEITGYDKYGVELLIETIDRVLKRYQKEAKRIRKYY